MKLYLTYDAVIEILKDWDIKYIKDMEKPAGYIDPEKKKIIINVANQSIRELGVTVYHEFFHIIYDDKGIEITEEEIETLARYYSYRNSDILDLIHSFL